MVDEKSAGPPTRIDAILRSDCAALAETRTLIEFVNVAARLPRGEDGSLAVEDISAALATLKIPSSKLNAIRQVIARDPTELSALVDLFLSDKEARDPWLIVLMYNTNHTILQYQLFLDWCDELAIAALLENQEAILDNDIFSPREMAMACARGVPALDDEVYKRPLSVLNAAADRMEERARSGLVSLPDDCLSVLQVIDRLTDKISLQPELRNYCDSLMGTAVAGLIEAQERNAGSTLAYWCAKTLSHLAMQRANKSASENAEVPKGAKPTPVTNRLASAFVERAVEALARENILDIDKVHDLRLRQKHHLERIMEEAEAVGDTRGFCDAARDLSIMLRRTPPPIGGINAAIERIDRAIERADELPATLRAELHNSRGITMRLAERYEDALASYRMARDLTNFHDAAEKYLTFLVNIGICIAMSDLLHETGHRNEARLAFDRVLETSKGHPEYESMYCTTSVMQAKILYFAGSRYRGRALDLLEGAIRHLETAPASSANREVRDGVIFHALQWLNRNATADSRRKMVELLQKHASLSSEAYRRAAIDVLLGLSEGRAEPPEIVGGMDHGDMLRVNVWASLVGGWRIILFRQALANGIDFVREHGDVLLDPPALDELQTFFSNVVREPGARDEDDTMSYLRVLIAEGHTEPEARPAEDKFNENDSQEDDEARHSAAMMRNLAMLSQTFVSLMDVFNERTWSGTIRMLNDRRLVSAEAAKQLFMLADVCRVVESHKEHEGVIRAHARMIDLILDSGEGVVPHYVADDDRKFAIQAAAWRMIQHGSWEDAYVTLELHPHLMTDDCLTHLHEEAEAQTANGDAWREVIQFIECCRNHDAKTSLELFRSRNGELRSDFLPKLFEADDQRELLRVARGLTGEQRRSGDLRMERSLQALLRTNAVARTIVIGAVLSALRERAWTKDEMDEPPASGDIGWKRSEVMEFLNGATVSPQGSAYVRSLPADAFQRFMRIVKFIRNAFPDDVASARGFLALEELLLQRQTVDQGGQTVPIFYLEASDRMPTDVIRVIEDHRAGRASDEQTSARIEALLSRSEIAAEPGLSASLQLLRAQCLFGKGRSPGWKRYKAAAAVGALAITDLSDVANAERVSAIKAEYLTMLAQLPGLDRELAGRVIYDLATDILRNYSNIPNILLTEVVVSGLHGLNTLMRFDADSGRMSGDAPLEMLMQLVGLADKHIPKGYVGAAWVSAKVAWVMANFGDRDVQESMIAASTGSLQSLVESYEASVGRLGGEGAAVLARAIFQLSLTLYRLTLSPELYDSETARKVVDDVVRRLQGLREDKRWSDPLLSAEVERLLARARIRSVRSPNHEDFVESGRLLLDAWKNLGPDFDPESACHEMSILAGQLTDAEEFELADKVFAQLFSVLPFLFQYAMGFERRQHALRLISASSRNWAAIRLNLKGPVEALSILEGGRALFLRERFAVERNARQQEDFDAYRKAIVASDECVEGLKHADPAQYLAPEISKIADAKERAHAARWRLSAAIGLSPDEFALNLTNAVKPLLVLFASGSRTIAMACAANSDAESASAMRWTHEELGEKLSDVEISRLVRGGEGWLRCDVEEPNPDLVLSQLSDVLFEPVSALLAKIDVSPGTVVRYMGYGVFSAIPVSALLRDGRSFGDLYPVETLSTLHLSSSSVKDEHARTHAHERVTVFDNPSDDFAFGALDLELLQIHDLVKESFTGPDVTRASFSNALANSTRIHYSGHSVFDSDDTSQSHFVLSGQEKLRSRELMLMIQRGPVREVFLSSCAAGVVGDGVSEEHEGLASAMLIAGASTVISALWPVDQIPTALLSLYYYLAQRDQELSPAEALASAQNKLRNTTEEQAAALLARLPNGRRLDLGQLKGVRAVTLRREPVVSPDGTSSSSRRPFSDPRHWAGFYCLSQA